MNGAMTISQFFDNVVTSFVRRCDQKTMMSFSQSRKEHFAELTQVLKRMGIEVRVHTEQEGWIPKMTGEVLKAIDESKATEMAKKIAVCTLAKAIDGLLDEFAERVAESIVEMRSFAMSHVDFFNAGKQSLDERWDTLALMLWCADEENKKFLDMYQ